MRISDWSSDVCSSDLHLGVRVGQVEQHLARLPNIGVIADAHSHVDATLCAGGEIDDRHAGDLAVGQYHFVVFKGAYQGLEHAHLLDHAIDAGDVDRSEEHTSELQSLMRISYAVFCLKKKKNNNKKSTTHTHETNIP